ncbi:MAG: endolytic transglycosylase MltG [Candidatus Pacebacteria bacterium]|nr:endolytic transglycosylase MltG [Candidatus Paceibacterota bacterium]
MQIALNVKHTLQRFYRRRRRLIVPGFFTVLAAFVVYGALFAPPRMFSTDSYVRVTQGESVSEIAEDLKEQSFIRSRTVFNLIAKLYGDRSVIAGEYYFSHPQSALTIVRRLVNGTFEVEPIKITIPEGTSSYGISQMLTAVPDFDTEAFYELASTKEGRLFPDTYYILPGADPASVVSMMEDNFRKQVSQGNITLSVASFGKSFNDVLVMASLLEKEANNSRDRRMIAGILWNRIKNGMLLQVDAVFPYIIGKNTYNITKKELLTDSPYNTYTNKGLPPAPITNPGVDAILDAVTPIDTDYVYYLSDQNGTMYYSVTYEQHLQNKAKYIGS